MSKKKIIFASAAASVIIMASSFGVTYAYLISSDYELNEFIVGENKIEVTEDFQPPSTLPENPEPFTKKPWVVNTGNLPCYVRMRADVSDDSAECDFYYNENKGYNNNDWYYNENDGYYYYTKILEAGSETQALFDKVMSGKAAPIDFDILIYAESITAKDEYENYQKAWNDKGITF